MSIEDRYSRSARSDNDVWREDARTDRAIELLHLCGAKTDANGEVIPQHKYSRSFRAVASHLTDLSWGGDETVTLSVERDRDRGGTTVTVSIEVDMPDGKGWWQEGMVHASEHAYDWHALAACRALLQYRHGDGTLMSTDEVVALLEQRRLRALRDAREILA